MKPMLLLACLVGVCQGAEPTNKENLSVEAYHLTYTRNGDIQGHGSCFAATKTSVFTALHNVVREGKNLNCFMIVNGVKYPLTVTKSCERLDIALCDVTGVILKPLPIDDEYFFTEFQIHLEGFPEGEYKKSIGTRGIRFWGGTCKDVLNVPFNHGCSGGCIVQAGRIIGMAVSGIPKDGELDRTKALYLPADVLKWFLAAPVK